MNYITSTKLKIILKQHYLITFFIFYLQFGFGQIIFEENVIIDNTYFPDNPTGIHATDLDGDGDLDVISASSGDDKVAWYENLDGLGRFGRLQVISSIANGAISVFSADLDGDGDMDILSASYNDDKIAWYKNLDGEGQFSSEIIITTNADNARSVYVSDVDGDGDMDVMSASRNDDKIAWYENLDGEGNFGSEIIVTTNADGAYSVFSIDIDGDGDMDILSASNTDDTIAWYENIDGQGAFGAETIISDTVTDAREVFAIDLDSDGDMDVLSASGNRIAWYENADGLGNFGTQQLIASNVDSARGVYASDLDGDGDIDVLSASNGNNRIAWYENTDGLANFGTEQVITNNTIGAQAVVSFDIDGDGNNDVLSSSISDDDKVVWYKNLDGLGDFSLERMVSYSAHGASSIYPADVNGDGIVDIVATSTVDDKVSWFQNSDGEGNFDYQQIISMAGNAPQSVFVIDIDYDGDADVLSVSSIDGKVLLHKNMNGQGDFDIEYTIDVNLDSAFYITAADLDGDTDVDVLVATSDYVSRIVWYENLDGQGTFGALQEIAWDADDSNQSSVSLGDLDGDGDLDVLSSSQDNDTIDWYENLDGQGTFGSQQIISTAVDGAESVSVADIDGDSDLDLIVTNRYGSVKVSWFENLDGQANFGPPNAVSSTMELATSIAYGVDVDNDNDIDILAGSSNTAYDDIFYYENIDGLGNFGSKQLIAEDIGFLTEIHLLDVDLDGQMDVVASAFLDDKIAWYKNIGLPANQINGSVSYDTEDDGCDSLDTPLEHMLVSTTNGSDLFSTFTLPNGVFQLFPSEGSFTTELINVEQLPYFNISPNSQISDFSGLGNTDNVDFCITPNGTFNDLSISVYPILEDPRPGFDTIYELTYTNQGTTELSGNVTFQFNDSKLNFLYATQTVNSQTANTLTFNYTNLELFESRTIFLIFNVYESPTTNIDDILATTATVNPVTGDETDNDNIFTLEQTVIGSYDPNDITCLEDEQILIEDTDKYLHYLIRFQNTGTASAINVRVENVLDAKLDWTTMQLENLSHNGRVEIVNGSDVSFIFDAINLPDSTSDEINSHGYIAYKIKPLDNVAIGDIFYNTADIFFDFNPPIATNTAATEIVETLSINDYGIKTVTLFPNPTKNILWINSNNSIEKVKLFNNLGQLLYSSTNTDSINLSGFKSGIYIIELQFNNQSYERKKIIRQ
jgi:hypothetical protein